MSSDNDADYEKTGWDIMPLEMLLENRANLTGRFMESRSFKWPILCYCCEDLTFKNDEEKKMFLVSIINRVPNWQLLGEHQRCLDKNNDVRVGK